MEHVRESELLLTALGEKLSKTTFKILIFCGVFLVVVGGFLVFLEFYEAAYYQDDIIMFNVLYGAGFGLFGLFVLIFAAPFRKMGSTALHIYKDFVVCKWLLGKNEVRIEYSQIAGMKVRHTALLEMQLGGPYNKAVFFRADEKNAGEIFAVLDARLSAKII